MVPESPRGQQEQLHLPPGFRFCPTDEELVGHYLLKKVAGEPFTVPIIAEVELYKFDPWELPEKALFGGKEWYFFSRRERKYPNGSRPNRTAKSGYWKATGVDKSVSTMAGIMKVGIKKSLVFYKGRPPNALKTNWIMHEYRLDDGGRKPPRTKGALRLDDWVLCRIYCKTSIPKQKDDTASMDSGDKKDILDYFPQIDDTKLMDLSELNSWKVWPTGHCPQPEHPNKDNRLETSNSVQGENTYAGEYYGHSQTKWSNSRRLCDSQEEMCKSGLISNGHMEDIADKILSSRLNEEGDHGYQQISTHSSSSTSIDQYVSNYSSMQHSPKNNVDDESVLWW